MNMMYEILRYNELQSLELVGDGDDIELIEKIEAAFNIKIHHEPATWYTVGDIYDCLLTKIGTSDINKKKCSGQMSFYIIRHILNKLAPNVTIKPDTDFADLSLKNHAPLKKKLYQDYNLRTPSIAMSGWGCLTIILLWIACGCWLYMNEISFWNMILPFFAGIGLAFILPKKYSGSIGEFSMLLADINYAHFVTKGARSDQLRLWEALGYIIEDETHFPREAINRETLLLTPSSYDKDWMSNFKKKKNSKFASLIALLNEAKIFLLSTPDKQKTDLVILSLIRDITRWIEQLEIEDISASQEIQNTFSPTSKWYDFSSRFPSRFSDNLSDLAQAIIEELNELK